MQQEPDNTTEDEVVIDAEKPVDKPDTDPSTPPESGKPDNASE